MLEQSRWRRKVWFGVGIIVAAFLMMACLRSYSLPRFHKSGIPGLSIGRLYILTQSYGGQMTRAIRNMMDQQCWAGKFKGVDVSITEPFSTQSQLVHTPQIWNEMIGGQLHTAARFSDYYDLTYFNTECMKVKTAQLVSWEKFRDSAPRVAISVSIPTHSCSGANFESKCVYSKTFQSFIDALINMGFNVVKSVCLTCPMGQPYKLEDFAYMLSSNNTLTDVSVFINTWRNFAFTQAWLQVPDYCKFAETPESSNFLVPSSLVAHHSQYYVKNFIRKKHFVGIMLRIERFLTLAISGRSSESIKSCLNKIVLIYNDIRTKKNVGAYITVDIGKFGSGIMQKRAAVSRFGKGSIEFITKSVEFMLKHLYNATVTLEDWENTFINTTRGITERGYIAMLQRTIASQSDCLILMGGGSFQQVAGIQYLNKMKDKAKTPCLHTVCTSESFYDYFKHHNVV